jgi:site-specific recombinase XerC
MRLRVIRRHGRSGDVTTLALQIRQAAPMLRANGPIYERAIKDKTYRQFPVGQDVARYLRAIRWSDYANSTLLAYEETGARLALDHADYENGLSDFCQPAGTELLRDFLDRHWGGKRASTRARHTSALRSLFAWAVGEGRIGWNPAAPIKAPKGHAAQERIAYNIGTLHRLVARQDTLRDQCALQLLCRMGLRKNELRLLTLGDIDLTRNLLVVHGKGGKVVVLPLAIPSLRRDLELHLQERSPYHIGEFLIYPRADKRRPMDPASVHRWFKRCLERADLPATLKTHEMRHSAADHLWRTEGDIVKAQMLLRHSSVATTQAYLHPTRDDLAAALERMDEGWLP